MRVMDKPVNVPVNEIGPELFCIFAVPELPPSIARTIEPHPVASKVLETFPKKSLVIVATPTVLPYMGMPSPFAVSATFAGPLAPALRCDPPEIMLVGGRRNL